MTNYDYSKIEILEWDGIDHSDYPDFCDAYIVRAKYNGVYMSDEEIDELNNNRDYVYTQLINYLY